MVPLYLRELSKTVILLSVTYCTHAMHIAVSEDFSAQIYGNVYQGWCAIHDSNELVAKKAVALSDGFSVDRFNVEERELLGWIRALIHARKDLGSRSVKEWTLSDLDKVNGNVNFFCNHTGLVRRQSGDIVWFLQPLTAAEESVFELTENAFNRCSHEPLIQRTLQSMRHKMYFFPDENSIEENVKQLFNTIKNREEHKQNVIVSASVLHGGLVGIHPFESGNKRTARIVSNLYLMQCGVNPICYDEQDPYLEALCEDLKYRSANALYTYMQGKLKQQHPGMWLESNDNAE